jgi:hypothetical protein
MLEHMGFVVKEAIAKFRVQGPQFRAWVVLEGVLVF